ncbi:MAG: RNA polymerase sigma factor [bacterium]|nr:RNA polymerase sigma factor [bacterium]
MNKEDKNKFIEVYSEYYPIIVGVAYTKVKNKEVAEDITQDLFIAYLKKIDSIENDRKWLYGSLRIEVLNYFTELKKRGEEVDIHDEEFESSEIALKFLNGFQETRVMLKEAIGEIGDETDKLIFDYIGVQYYTYNEAAEVMGWSRSKVVRHYERIVSELRDYLRKKGINNIEDLL